MIVLVLYDYKNCISVKYKFFGIVNVPKILKILA